MNPELRFPSRPDFYEWAGCVPSSMEVQFGQRVALIGMDVMQCGHSFVVTSGLTSACLRLKWFSCLMTIKIEKAMIKKSIMLLMNKP